MRLPRMSTRLLLLTVALLALVLGGIKGCHDFYYAELIHTKAHLSKVRGITDIHVYGSDDITYEVHLTTFAIAGRPDALIGIRGPLDDPGHLRLERLGPWEFHETSYGHMGATDLSGKPIESPGYNNSIDVGSLGEYGAMLPVKVRDANDLVAHYDELVRHFSTWPDQKRWGEKTSPTGMKTRYCVSPAGTSLAWPPPGFPGP